MKVLVIFLILIGFVGTTFAIPEFTESEKVYGADAVIIGQVLSYYDEGEYRFYEISVMNTLSGKLPKETITMRSINESGFDPIDPYNVFEESDLVLLYLKDYGRGFLESTNFSKVIPEGQLQNTIDKMKVTVDISSLSPLKQYQTGVSIDEIQCKDGLVLIQKHDGSPACVTESTKQKLIERGWTKVKYNTTDESTTNLLPHKNQDATELASYRDIRSFIQIDENAPILSDNELDRTLEELRHVGLPIVMSAIDYENGVIAIWTPDVSNEEPFKEHLGDIPFVLLFEEAPPRWEHGVPKPEPEPEPQSYDEAKLRDAQKALENAYFDTVNLGGFYIKDVIAGYGTYDNTLAIDIPARFMEPDSIKAIRQDVQSIVGDNVKIDYVLYDEPIERHIETVMPYWWSGFLTKQGIEYLPKEQTYVNNGDGFHEHDKVCSPIIASNGTDLYISSTFDLEPFQITGTFIDKKQPDDCHKIWKTDKILTEPDRVTMLWLKNQWG